MNKTVGSPAPVSDAILKATGRMRYTDDLKLPGILHAKILFSPKAHARIKSIDFSKAQALSGVKAIAWYGNTSPYRYNSCGETIDHPGDEQVFSEVMRFIGDRVAALAADTLEQAEQALRLIEVEYEDLPFYIEPKDSLKDGAYPIQGTSNLIGKVDLNAGDFENGLAESDCIFEDSYSCPAIHHAAMEPHVTIADYQPDGKLTVYSPTQDVFGVRTNLCRIFGLPMNKVRVVNPALGGGFGGKVDINLEGVTAQLSMLAGWPVKLCFNRKEEIISTRTRHAMSVTLKTGMKKDGTMHAQQANILVNGGAYTSGTMSVVWAQSSKFFRNRKTPNLSYHASAAFTNTPIAGAMRGYGSPQLTFAQECQLNKIARQMGISILDLQLKNLVTSQDHDLRNGKPFGNAQPGLCVTQGASLFNWDSALSEQAESIKKAGRYRLGVGMAVGVHGNGMYGVIPDTCGVFLKMNEDATLSLISGVSEMGNGIVTMQRMMVAEILAIQQESITCISADTELALWDLGDYSSRGVFVCGQAAAKSARKLADLLLSEAAEMLDFPVEALELAQGTVCLKADREKCVGLAEIVKHAHWLHGRDLCAAETFASNALVMSYGAHFVKAKVDTHTGKLELLDYVACHDLGKVINPLHAEGQLEGAIQMGLGYALTEDLGINKQGLVTNNSFGKYHLIHAHEMPRNIKIDFVDSYEPAGPFGAKSIGECAVVPVAAAVANAISNALNVDFNDLPITSQAILKKIKKA
ncbi:MAG: molybdopterin cofactor-binding domain-containing protein [Anaerolineaceae bacterium]|nr:molybdopterin cofactor-binding domain-containing protein [Anaerolineaceae bacterium]